MNKKLPIFNSINIEIPEKMIYNNRTLNPLTKSNNLTTRKKEKAIKIIKSDVSKPIITYDGDYTEIKKKEKKIKEKKIKEKK
jgi:hypothetical protein